MEGNVAGDAKSRWRIEGDGGVLSIFAEVALGLFLIFFVLSLAASAVMSMLQKAIHLRARNLRMGIVRLFGGDREIINRFYAHPLITPATTGGPTHTIDAEEFAAALARAILPKGAKGDPIAALPSAIANLPDGRLKDRLSLIVPNEFASRDEALASVKMWFENASRGISHAYELLVRRIMYIIAAILVIGLNVNAISIGETLFSNSSLRQTLADAAVNIASKDEAEATSAVAQAQAIECVRAIGGFPIGWEGLQDFLNMPVADPSKCEELLGPEAADALVGVGRQPVKVAGFDQPWELTKDLAALLLGWLITIIAVAQGAPFWFDLLRSFTGRGSTTPTPAKALPEGQID